MFQPESNVLEVQEVFKEIISNPEKMFEMLRIDMKQMCEQAIIGLLKVELSHFLGRDFYERSKGGSKNYLILEHLLFYFFLT